MQSNSLGFKDADSSSSDNSNSENNSSRCFAIDSIYRKNCIQDHGRTRQRVLSEESMQRRFSSPRAETSFSTDITDFRDDFQELNCKMTIFGESLKLCKCIAHDFQAKMTIMEKRLQSLERRIYKTNTNKLSSIISKNKKLSHMTVQEAKKLQMCGTEDEMRLIAAKICRNYLHGAWQTIDPAYLDFRRISGGLSNFLYYVALPDVLPTTPIDSEELPSPTEDSDSMLLGKRNSNKSISFMQIEETKKVLIRIYGQVHGERAMDAIVTESVIFTLLSERKLGPKLFGVFSGGRIEEYIDSRPLLTAELSEPALSMKIAEKMATIHSMDVPLTKEANWIWKTMYKWLNTINKERQANEYVAKNEKEEAIMKRLHSVKFENELTWLKKFLSTVDSPVVFCHNDMQEGNILLLQEEIHSSPYDDLHFDPPTKPTHSMVHALSMDDTNTTDSDSSHISDCGEPKIYIIDFEYCAYNHRGFDIANHFQEWAYDYTNKESPFYYENRDAWPTLEQKEIFIREYLKHYQKEEDKDTSVGIEAVNHLLDEVEAFAPASHLFWCLWSVVNATKSKIPFGYWEYAESRLETYLRLKQEVVKKDKFGYAQKRKICEVDI